MKNNKISWIALGIALIAVIVSFVVGGINQPQQIIREIIEKPSLGGPTRFSQVGAGDAIEFWKRISLAARDQLECVQNITGSTIFVDPLQTQVHLTGNGSASTSQTLNIATSSDGVNIGGLESFVGGGYYTGSSSVDVDSIRDFFACSHLLLEHICFHDWRTAERGTGLGDNTRDPICLRAFDCHL